MGKQAKLRKARRALRTAVHCENLTVDEANEAYREAKGRGPTPFVPGPDDTIMVRE